MSPQPNYIMHEELILLTLNHESAQTEHMYEG